MIDGEQRSGIKGFFGWLCGAKGGRPFHFSTVGVIVLLGVFVVVFVPDDPTEELLSERPVVVIDAGHGGKDAGARYKGVSEKNLTLDLALRLDAVLRQRGFKTMLTRKEDVFVPLRGRSEKANRLPGESIFISLHFNQGRGKGAHGIETFYAVRKAPLLIFATHGWRWMGFFTGSKEPDRGEELAAEVQLGMVSRTGARNRGIRPRSLHVTRETRMPSILVEGGFLTDPMERTLLTNGDYLQRLAEGIADGVVSWYERQPKRPPPALAEKEEK